MDVVATRNELRHRVAPNSALLSLGRRRRRERETRSIPKAPEDTTIGSAIISLGRTLKLKVITEGVELAEEVAFLNAEKCDEAQGSYFGRPVTAEQFAGLNKMQVN